MYKTKNEWLCALVNKYGSIKLRVVGSTFVAYNNSTLVGVFDKAKMSGSVK